MFNGHKEAKRITNIKNYVRIGNDSINIRMELQFIKPHAQDQHLLNVDYCDLYYKIKKKKGRNCYRLNIAQSI